MKQRVREAIFNLLGPAVRGKHAVDLFAGTGAVALEALSRGAARATLIERHFPTARVIRQNIAMLSVEQVTEVATADVFFWARRLPDLGTLPWVVFCSPPYSFYAERTEQMLWLIRTLLERAPPESLFAVEADERFDFGLLPGPGDWDVRSYPPAVVGIYRNSEGPPHGRSQP